MVRCPVPFQQLLLAAALVTALPACSTVNGWLGDKDRNEMQVVDGPRRKPVLNPASASQINAPGANAAPMMQYDGYVPPSYAAEPVQAPAQSYVLPGGGYYDVPLPNIEPVTPEFPKAKSAQPPASPSTMDTVRGWFGNGEEQQPPKANVEPMAYEQTITSDEDHGLRKPLPRLLPAEPVATIAAAAPLTEPKLAPLLPVAEASKHININTHSVVASETPPVPEFHLWDRLFGSRPAPTPLIARTDYPSLYEVPPPSPALRDAKTQAPAIKEELKYDGWVSRQKKRELHDEVEADKPNSLREEMKNGGAAPQPQPVPVAPPARPYGTLPPPAPPRDLQAHQVPNVLPPSRSTPESEPNLPPLVFTPVKSRNESPTIAARGEFIAPWYMPASTISVGIIGRASSL